MSNDEFIFSVNTLMGCRYPFVKALEKRFHVEDDYKKTFRISKWLSRVISALSYFDDIRYQGLSGTIKIQKHPIYVLGHWRSGTTLLHNLMCSYRNTSYPTTYQTVFPNNLFFSKRLIKWILQQFLPERRLVDQAVMHVDYPQEEEFALGSEAGFSFYYWLYFPGDRQVILDEYLTLPSDNQKRDQSFTRSYLRFIKRCMLNIGGEQYVAKNPPSMARIPFLICLFPQSRFVYLERNPYEVILSSFRFFKGYLRIVQLQDIDDESLWDFIIGIYKYLYEKYQQDKALIPPQNLVEIKYEHLITDTESVLDELHQKLFPELEPEESKLKEHLGLHKDHTIKKYKFEDPYIERVNRELGDLITLQGYDKL